MNVTFFIRSVILLYVALHEKSSQIERKSTLELLRHYKNEILYPEIENPAVFDDKDIMANKKLTKVKCSTDKHFTEQRFFGEATKIDDTMYLGIFKTYHNQNRMSVDAMYNKKTDPDNGEKVCEEVLRTCNIFSDSLDITSLPTALGLQQYKPMKTFENNFIKTILWNTVYLMCAIQDEDFLVTTLSLSGYPKYVVQYQEHNLIPIAIVFEN